MLEELFNLVKSVAGEQTQNAASVPADNQNEIVAEATNTVASGLRNMVAGGGLQNVVSLFGGSGNNQQTSGGGMLSNPIVNMMVGHFAEKLMSKFNLGSGQASSLASSLIPNVINGLVHKTNDPNNSSFSLDGLLNSITGGTAAQVIPQQAGSGGGLQDILNQLGGGNSNSGAGGLMDIVTKLAGGAQAQQQKNGGEGLMDLIKGFIK